MDITLSSIIGSTIVIIIAIVFGIKKVLDSIVELRETQQNNMEAIKSETYQVTEILKNEIREFEQNILNYQKDILTNLHATQNSIEKGILEQGSNIVTKTNSISTTIESLNKSLVNDIKQSNESIQDSLAKMNKELENSLITQDKNMINISTKVESNYISIVGLVNNLRLDNLINLTNEIGKYKEGIYEDEHFLQEVGHCKIIKLTDKNTKEVTQVYYHANGEKAYTETFTNGKLKYTMKYENGKLITGTEFNEEGETLFEYFYDDAEEISKKIEYIYDKSNQLKDTIKTNY